MQLLCGYPSSLAIYTGSVVALGGAPLGPGAPPTAYLHVAGVLLLPLLALEGVVLVRVNRLLRLVRHHTRRILIITGNRLRTCPRRAQQTPRAAAEFQDTHLFAA